ncbi:MAG: hypothetical protein IKX36_01930 [Prevotella sp.]|nr:hypothetical protein [Prevotella sp.]
MKEIGQLMLTFFLAVIGWIIFRAESMSQAVDYLYRMFTHIGHVGGLGSYFEPFVLCVILLIIEWVQRNKQHVLQLPSTGIFKSTWVRYLLYAGLFILIVLKTGEVQTFIYFQF